MANINWLRIVSNTGYTFFWTIVGLTAMGTITNIEMSLERYMICVLIVAGGQAGAVFFRELTKEAEKPPEYAHEVAEKPDDEKYYDGGIYHRMSPMAFRIYKFFEYVT